LRSNGSPRRHATICNGSYQFMCSKESMKHRDEGIQDSSRITENCDGVGKCRTDRSRVPDRLRWTAVRSLKEAAPSPPNVREISMLHPTDSLQFLPSDFYRRALGLYPEKNLDNVTFIMIILAHFKPVPRYINNSLYVFLS
jgi:hypothetical protein